MSTAAKPSKNQHPLSWPAKEMQRAIAKFRCTGDYTECLVVLKAGDAPLLTLQRALGRTEDPVERAAFEDIGFYLSQDRNSPAVSPELIKQVTEGLRQHYGQHASGFIEKELEDLLTGILSRIEPAPPLNALIAALGIEVAKRVDNPLRVARAKRGETLIFYTTQCPKCGGEPGGQGHVLCPQCLERARRDVAPMMSIFKHMHPEADEQILAQQHLIENKHRYGCSACHHAPAVFCACAAEVEIPRNVESGWILKGNHPADDSAYYCSLILED